MIKQMFVLTVMLSMVAGVTYNGFEIQRLRDENAALKHRLSVLTGVNEHAKNANLGALGHLPSADWDKPVLWRNK